MAEGRSTGKLGVEVQVTDVKAVGRKELTCLFHFYLLVFINANISVRLHLNQQARHDAWNDPSATYLANCAQVSPESSHTIIDFSSFFFLLA